MHHRLTPEKAVKNLIKALGKGVLKIMSKMGISRRRSYAGAQAFEAVGLRQEFVDAVLHRHQEPARRRRASTSSPPRTRRGTRPPTRRTAPSRAHERLRTGGEYQWRRDGPPHLFNPDTVFRLQHATRTRRYDIFRDYTRLVDEQAENLMTLRGLFKLRTGARKPVPLDEVESVASIVKRFTTGAMSYGSITQEAHETLAIAMNRIGAQCNTGEGGEDVDRLLDPDAPQRHQAGRIRPVRRHQHVPHPRRRHPDQDGAGRQAGRGRPAAAGQGLPVDRPHPARDRGRRPDLAAAAPRHLLDRRPQAADLRPEARESRRPAST